MPVRWFLLPVVLLTVRQLPAQGHEDHGAAQLSAKAIAQVAEARRVASAFDTPDKARAAGYLPRFGDVPLQGEHWVRRELVLNATFDIARPPVLMFSLVKGVETLVGVAYAYQVTEAAPSPEGFDGDADEWHEHPLLSMPGRRLTMTHVWFVDSPKGVFAHDNPMLPFAARGLPLPPNSWLDRRTVTNLARALGLAQPPSGQRVRLEQMIDDSARRALAQHRASIDSEVRLLDRAQRAGDSASYRAAAQRAIAAGAGIIATLRTIAAKNPMIESLMGRALKEFLGGEID